MSIIIFLFTFKGIPVSLYLPFCLVSAASPIPIKAVIHRWLILSAIAMKPNILKHVCTPPLHLIFV